MYFIDFHTHKNFYVTNAINNVIEIKNVMQTEWLEFDTFLTQQDALTEGGREICNFRENHQTHNLQSQIFSVGLHPYFVCAKTLKKDLDFLAKVLAFPNVVALGECGLDRLKSVATIDFQLKIFAQQIELAEQFRKPVVIHCVRAFSELLRLQQKMRPKTPLIVHGFDKNEAILKDLIRQDFFISVGASVLRGEKWGELLPKIPLEKLLLETDDKPFAIQSIYEQVSQILNIEIHILQDKIFDNYKNLITQ
jgi:TatD DNase family protein